MGARGAAAARGTRPQLPVVESEAERRRRYGRLAGVLFAGASAVSALPTLALLQPAPDPVVYVMPALGIASGIACLLIPWHRISPAWLHVLVIAAAAQITVSNEIADPSYGFYYVFIAVYVAYVFSSARLIAAHMGLVTVALLSPLVYGTDPQATVRETLLIVPGLVLVAGSVAHLRRLLEQDRGRYQAFAEEAYGLVLRIRGRAGEEPIPVHPIGESVAPAMDTGLAELADTGRKLGLRDKQARK